MPLPMTAAATLQVAIAFFLDDLATKDVDLNHFLSFFFLLQGAAVIAYALLGVFSEQRHPALIHWFACE